MINFCGYNFCMDKDALNPYPTNINNIKEVKLENSIYDHINITKDVLFPYTSDKPQWDISTILDCGFDEGTSAGNVDFTLGQLTSIKIKRRKKGDFEWITVRDVEIKNQADLATVLKDYFVPSNEDFEYAVVPILNGVEGEYIIGSIFSKFNGVFISDINNNFKLQYDVKYNGRTSVQEVGQIVPLGKKYPVIIKNGEADYDTGSVSSLFLGKNYDKTHKIDRKDVVEQVDEFLSFLKNGKPKILRDWNGLIRIVGIVGNPSVSYNNSYGMGVAVVSFEWVEQGKYDNEEDLYNNGFIKITT